MDEPKSDHQSPSWEKFRGQKGVDGYGRKEIYRQLHQKVERTCDSNSSDQNKQTNGGSTWEFERGT